MTVKHFVAALALTGLAFSAYAVPIDVSESNGERSLQRIIEEDVIASGYTTTLDVNADQVSPSEVWLNSDSGLSPTRYVAAIAGLAGQTSFGIYDPFNIGNTYTLFDGSVDGVGSGTVFGLDANGDIYSSFSDFTGITFSSTQFGFFIETPEYTMYSQSSLNPDGSQQMVAFQGGRGDTINLPGFGGNTIWTEGGWLLAWEDRPYLNSDQDFNDLVVFIESIVPVPEPGTLALLGLGIAGLAAARRRQKA